MKAAILGNGPSRTKYFDNKIHYDIVAGCNVPWINVDWTVVLDDEVVSRWAKEPDLITVPTYFSRHAWMKTDQVKQRRFFKQFLKEIVVPGKDYDTSGHVACKILMREGYTDIDLYGFDSWFEDTIESTSHELFNNYPDNKATFIRGWRKLWNEMMENHPAVKLNFIR